MTINNRSLDRISTLESSHIINNVNQGGHGEIYFKNKELRRAIIASLGYTSSEVLITPSKMETITHIHASGLGIDNIYPLKYCKNLEVLDLSNNNIKDISPLSNCIRLKELLIANNSIETLAAVGSMKRLTILDSGYNLINCITPVSSCTSLRLLFLNDNRIDSMNGLTELVCLRVLDMSSNFLREIHGISELSQLKMLCLNNNPIEEKSTIMSSKTLQYLWIYDSRIRKNILYVNKDDQGLRVI